MPTLRTSTKLLIWTEPKIWRNIERMKLKGDLFEKFKNTLFIGALKKICTNDNYIS